MEKKVKHLEHELMLANQKAMKYEEEARKVVEPQTEPQVNPNQASPTPANEPQAQAQPPGLPTGK